MPSLRIRSPDSIDQAEMSITTNNADTIPKRKKSILGRIKSKLATKLGRRKSISVESPTPANLFKPEPETTKLATTEQQNEEEGLTDGKDDFSSKKTQQQPQNCMTEINNLDDNQADSVQQFQTLSSSSFVDINDQSITDLKSNLEEDNQKCFELPDDTEVNDKENDDVVDEIIDEEEAVNINDSTTASPPEQAQTDGGLAGNDEDDEDTLEVFDKHERNQQCSSSHEPEQDEEVPASQDHKDTTFESFSHLLNDDLVIIGVTPSSLRNRSASYDHETFREEEEPLDIDPGTVSTPRICTSLSSPLKRVRLGPGVEVICPKSPSSSILPHPPLQEIREEDESFSSGEHENSRLIPARFEGHFHGSSTSEIPITSATMAIVSSENEEREVSSPTENDINPKAETKTYEQVFKTDETESETLDAGASIMREFGERIVTLLSADPWGDRQDGFDAIKLAVKKANVCTMDPISRQRLLCASLAAVQCGVEDRVAPVMFCALECFRSILKEFARVLPDDRVVVDTQLPSAAVLNTQLSALVGALVRKVGDSNKRTQREATQALVRIARLRSLRAVPHLLLHLSGREVPPRRQLETLRRLLQELGLATQLESSSLQQQLTVATVLEFVAPSLKIAEEKTRKVAVEILADLQMRTSNSIAWHSQLARIGAVKPEMLRVLIRRVEELISKRDQLQAATLTCPAATGSGVTNQAEQHMDDEAAFPPAELVDVPQEDAQRSITLLETALLSAQNVVGPVCWRKLSSKTWSDRKEALLEVEKVITEAKSDLRDTRPTFGSAAQETFVAYCAVLRRALSDGIAPVVNTALDTFVTLVKVYGPRIEWRGVDVRDMTLLTLLQLLKVMQKSNTRTTRAACRGILKLARLPNAWHPLRYVLSCVFGGEGSTACDPQVQMHLLRLLVPEFGFQADGLGASRVLDAVSKGLTHNSARVRRSAADVALSAQRLLGREFVLGRLQGVRPVTLKELEKSFVDGVGSSGRGERPQTVHATTAEVSSPAAIGGSGLPLVSLGGLREFSSRRLLNSAPVGVGRLQCTPLYEEVSASSSSKASALVLSNEEENLMDSILDNF